MTSFQNAKRPSSMKARGPWLDDFVSGYGWVRFAPLIEITLLLTTDTSLTQVLY